MEASTGPAPAARGSGARSHVARRPCPPPRGRSPGGTPRGPAEAHRGALLDGDLGPRAAAALAACAAGDPAPALVLGRDLHWLGRPEAAPLLVAAYTALGRPALAGIAAAHHAQRELPNVGVLRLRRGDGAQTRPRR